MTERTPICPSEVPQTRLAQPHSNTRRATRMALFICSYLLVLLAALPLRATDLASGFDQANKLYEEGKYAAAADAYDKLSASGTASEALYFNRGNALFKAGQLGRAIASYRLAAQLAPRDPDLRANLQFARTQARGGSPYRADPWQRYLETLTVNEWTLLAAAALWLMFALLALAQWRPELRRALRPWFLASSLAVLLLGISLGAVLVNTCFTTFAIVVVGEADVRNGPLDESASAFKVRDGAELTVLDRKDDWLQILDSGQRVGWLRQNQVLILNPTANPKPAA
jgi:tetratricopeptide (TPR) repeat protein